MKRSIQPSAIFLVLAGSVASQLQLMNQPTAK